ncbi:unnamed protein product [Somion occarium]|uniref:F-box domain-containing protein n=1 Tax=Somion occarium TaxID=3059160 RepID=A0ABP1DM71_9APHY
MPRSRSSSYRVSVNPIATLPIEVFEGVMDHLRSYRQTLDACSLVCKAWLPIARVRLYESMSVPLYDHDTMDEFIEFLETAPNILPLIVDLRIHGIDLRTEITLHDGHLNVILSLLSNLRNLHLELLRLSIQNTASSAVLTSTEAELTCARYNLHRLRLEHIDAKTISPDEDEVPLDVFEFLGIFAQIHTLELWKCHFHPRTSLPPSSADRTHVPKRIAVTSIIINQMYLASFYAYMQRHLDLPQLHALHTFGNTIDALLSASTLIQRPDTNITTFTFTLPDQSILSEAEIVASHFSSCTSLDAVYIQLASRYQRTASNFTEEFRDILLFTTHFPKSIRHLVFGCVINSGNSLFMENLKTRDWYLFENDLSKYPSLQSLTFRLYDQSVHPMDQDVVPIAETVKLAFTDVLPLLARRVSIRFTRPPSISVL